MKQPVKEIQAFIEYDETSIRDIDDLISFKISCDSGLCKTAMRKLEVKYTGSHNLLGKWIKAYFGVRLPSGEFEYLNYGSFLVSEQTETKDTETTDVVAYDVMINAMTPYVKLDIEYPLNLIDYTRILCATCGLELSNDIFGKNICPSNVDKWELGHYNLSGAKEDYNKTRCRLKELIPVKPNTEYYVNTNSSNTSYDFVIRGYDENKNFITSYGSCPTGTILNTDDVYYLGVGMYDYNSEIGNEGKIILASIESGETKPFICLTSETDKNFAPYNSMNDWLIERGLWENIDGITYRDIFQQIAQATGSTCIVHDDMIYFKPLTDTNENLTYDNMFKLKLEALYGEINSVVLARTPSEDNVFLKDDVSIETNGLTEFKIENNEIVDKDRESAITPIFEALNGIRYYPFETTTEGLGWYEIADNLTIENDLKEEFKTSLFNYTITIDGSVKETLKTTAESKAQTQYQYAKSIAKRVKNTEVIVNKQDQYIKQIVSDIDGINEKYTSIYQDIENIINTVQNGGGNNLLKNSVMFAYNSENVPDNWETEGDGDLIITSDTESLRNGGRSGHSFTLLNKTVRQKVLVKQYDESNAILYTFSTKIKKDTLGSCYVKIYNEFEEYVITLVDGENADYKDYELRGMQPKQDFYFVEFYGTENSNATFTDNMFSIGERKTPWVQANGEIMNTKVNINVNGVLVKSSVYLGDYTVMSPLEFAGYTHIGGVPTKIFSLNKDVTKVRRLEAEKEIKMGTLKVISITEGDTLGWAFVPAT